MKFPNFMSRMGLKCVAFRGLKRTFENAAVLFQYAIVIYPQMRDLSTLLAPFLPPLKHAAINLKTVDKGVTFVLPSVSCIISAVANKHSEKSG